MTVDKKSLNTPEDNSTGGDGIFLGYTDLIVINHKRNII